MKEQSTSNRSDNEYKYYDLSKKMIEEMNVDLIDYIDDPFVFVSRQSVAASLAKIELFKKIREIKGSIVECGVYKGNGSMLFYHLSSIYEPYALNRKIISFDSFEGFKKISDKDEKNIDPNDFSDTNYEVLNSISRINDLNRPISHIQKIEIIEGEASKTIPKYKKEHPELIIALLYLDFDLYEPTKIALKELFELVPNGGIVAFDELNSKKWKGETIAFKEYFSELNIRLQKFYYDPWMSYFIVDK